jgi:hypothetical protein
MAAFDGSAPVVPDTNPAGPVPPGNGPLTVFTRRGRSTVTAPDS